MIMDYIIDLIKDYEYITIVLEKDLAWMWWLYYLWTCASFWFISCMNSSVYTWISYTRDAVVSPYRRHWLCVCVCVRFIFDRKINCDILFVIVYTYCNSLLYMGGFEYYKYKMIISLTTPSTTQVLHTSPGTHESLSCLYMPWLHAQPFSTAFPFVQVEPVSAIMFSHVCSQR